MPIVAFEGINGAGKSELIARVRDILIENGRSCVSVDPAGFGRIGKIIRNQIVEITHKSNANYDSVLFAALRAEGAMALRELFHEKPSTMVLLERWSLALAAYGSADGASALLVTELRKLLREILVVDMTILLNVSGKTAFKRLAASSRKNRFEARGPSYLECVAENYRQFAASDGDVAIVDSSTNVLSSFEGIWSALSQRWNYLR